MVEKELNLSHKMKPRYHGPFVAHRRTKGGSYVLEDINGVFISQEVAAIRFYPYLARNVQELFALGEMPKSGEESLGSSSEDDL